MTTQLSHRPTPPLFPQESLTASCHQPQLASSPRHHYHHRHDQEAQEEIEMARLDAGSSVASIDDLAPPPYSAVASPFQPTVQLQIETPGKRLLSFPLPLRPDPIPIFPVLEEDDHINNIIIDSGGSSSVNNNVITLPKFISIRPTRSSGSCFLVVSGGPAAGEDESSQEDNAVSTTTYRFGPGRSPRVRLFLPGGRKSHNSPPSPSAHPPIITSGRDSEPANNESATSWDDFELKSSGLLTRSVHFRTRLGTFEWRYASRKERKPLGADSLLVLDRIVRVANAGEADEEIRTPVVQFIRNAALRTPGSRGSSAGNG
ncbi:hypothetical protein B0H63DRAFT_470700, partial [Podospora didyma]